MSATNELCAVLSLPACRRRTDRHTARRALWVPPRLLCSTLPHLRTFAPDGRHVGAIVQHGRMLSSPVTPFQWLTFAIACLGALGTLANATWNIVQFRLNGYRIAVEATHGVLFATPGDLTRATWNLNVRVSNRGRAAVTLRSIEVEPSEGVSPTVSYSDWVGPTISGFRLEAGSEQVWRIDDPSNVQGMLDGGSGDGTVCTFVVTLATGASVRSEQIEIHPSGIDGLEITVVTVRGNGSTPV